MKKIKNIIQEKEENNEIENFKKTNDYSNSSRGLYRSTSNNTNKSSFKLVDIITCMKKYLIFNNYLVRSYNSLLFHFFDNSYINFFRE